MKRDERAGNVIAVCSENGDSNERVFPTRRNMYENGCAPRLQRRVLTRHSATPKRYVCVARSAFPCSR